MSSAEGALTEIVAPARSTTASSQPVGLLVADSVLMFCAVKPTVADPPACAKNTAGESSVILPESLSLLHATTKTAAVTTTAISLTNPLILLKFTEIQLKNLCKDTKKRDKSYKDIPNYSFGNNYCRLLPNEL